MLCERFLPKMRNFAPQWRKPWCNLDGWFAFIENVFFFLKIPIITSTWNVISKSTSNKSKFRKTFFFKVPVPVQFQYLYNRSFRKFAVSLRPASTWLPKVTQHIIKVDTSPKTPSYFLTKFLSVISILSTVLRIISFTRFLSMIYFSAGKRLETRAKEQLFGQIQF